MQTPPPIAELLNQLTTMADNVESALAEARVDWGKRPAAEEWSLTEIICHLRDVEKEVHQVRFRALLASDNAFLVGVSADEWAEERGYEHQDGRKALTDFLDARLETSQLLQGLPVDLWQRQARHAFFGRTTMHELLYLAIQHDQIHWEQIVELLDFLQIDTSS